MARLKPCPSEKIRRLCPSEKTRRLQKNSRTTPKTISRISCSHDILEYCLSPFMANGNSPKTPSDHEELRYDPKRIEEKWSALWAKDQKLYAAEASSKRN